MTPFRKRRDGDKKIEIKPNLIKRLGEFILFGNWKTIKGKFIHAFMNIAIAAVLMLVVALTTFIWLRDHALTLAEQRGPMAQAAMGLDSGLQRSLSAIRGWVSVPDKHFLKVYKDTWSAQVWPSFNKLKKLGESNDNEEIIEKLKELNPKLVLLFNIQWTIADIAHTTGNNPALKFTKLSVAPVLKGIIGLVDGVIELQEQSGLTDSRKVALLKNLKSQLLLSSHALQAYALTQHESDHQEFLTYFNSALALSEDKDLYPNGGEDTWINQEAKRLYNSLTPELLAYQFLSQEAVYLVQDGETNIANQWLEFRAMPLEIEITKLLNNIVETQQTLLAYGSQQVADVGSVAPWVMALLIASTFTIAVLLAVFAAMQLVRPISNLSSATKKLASHQLNKDLPVSSKDELGQLTISFNKMRASLQASEEQTEKLLLNTLPKSIVKRLRNGEELIVDQLNDVSVVFLDLVGFTKLASSVPPKRLIQILSYLFAHFDTLVEKHHLEKIKTIGDAYMVAGGAPEPNKKHLENSIEFALEVVKSLDKFNKKHKTKLQVRVGVHVGQVIAGVIGQSRFTYDLWGDTVNIASRMESHGIPNSVQVTDAVYNRLKNKYDFEKRGEIEIKGKEGEHKVYLVKGKKLK